MKRRKSGIGALQREANALGVPLEDIIEFEKNYAALCASGDIDDRDMRMSRKSKGTRATLSVPSRYDNTVVVNKHEGFVIVGGVNDG